jgi:hypothetical protein
LLQPDGRLWELPLYSAIHLPEYTPLVEKILDEKLIDPKLIDDAARLPRLSGTKWSGMLCSLSDPFVLSLGKTKFMKIITDHQIVHFRFGLTFSYHDKIPRYPFSGMLFFKLLATDYKTNVIYLYIYIPGTILIRFEKSALPQHVHKPALVVRVLDILSPVKCVIPSTDFQMPEKGQLITKRRHGIRYTWSLDRRKDAAKCLELLLPKSTEPSPLECECIR